MLHRSKSKIYEEMHGSPTAQLKSPAKSVTYHFLTCTAMKYLCLTYIHRITPPLCSLTRDNTATSTFVVQADVVFLVFAALVREPHTCQLEWKCIICIVGTKYSLHITANRVINASTVIIMLIYSPKCCLHVSRFGGQKIRIKPWHYTEKS